MPKMKTHKGTKKRFRILSLTDNTPYILAWGNDEGFDRVFVVRPLLGSVAGGAGSFLVTYGAGSASPDRVILSQFTAVPEPSEWALLALGGGILYLAVRASRPSG